MNKLVHLNVSTKLAFSKISEKFIKNVAVTKVTNLLKLSEILRMSNRNLSILHEISNHCITVMLDQWAMRSVLNCQIDVDDTTKFRIVLKNSI